MHKYELWCVLIGNLSAFFRFSAHYSMNRMQWLFENGENFILFKLRAISPPTLFRSLSAGHQKKKKIHIDTDGFDN